MNEIRIEKEIDTEGLNIIQIKEHIEAVIAEFEAKGFDPKKAWHYLDERNQALEVDCCRDETPEETAKRVAEEEEAQRLADEARAAAIERIRLRDLEEQAIRQQQAEHAAWNYEAARVLAGKTLAELRRMSTI